MNSEQKQTREFFEKLGSRNVLMSKIPSFFQNGGFLQGKYVYYTQSKTKQKEMAMVMMEDSFWTLFGY